MAKKNSRIDQSIQEIEEKLSLTDKKFDEAMRKYFLSIFKKMKSFKEFKKQIETLKINGVDQEVFDRIKFQFNEKLEKEFGSVLKTIKKSTNKEEKKILRDSSKKRIKKYEERSSKLNKRMILWITKTNPLKYSAKELSL